MPAPSPKASDRQTPGAACLGTWAQIGAGIANVEFYDGALAATDSSLMIGGAQDSGTSPG